MFRKGPKKGIQIGKPDVKLFRYLYENKVATAEQIRRDIYPSYNDRSVHNRLKKMIHHRLLKRKYNDSLGGKLVYQLGEVGFNRFIKQMGARVKKELGSSSVAHDLCLLEIRHYLQRNSQIKQYFPENLISGDDLVLFGNDSFLIEDIRPDAVVEIDLKGKSYWVTLEYEAAQKFANRYKELFRKYYANKSIPAVLYVCRDEALLNHVRNIEKREIDDQTPKFYYSDFSKWKTGEKILFQNQRDSYLSLGV